MVDFTIRMLSEGNKHNAGNLKEINHRKYAKQVAKKVLEPGECAMFKALSHVLISQIELSDKRKEKRKRNASRK